MLYDRKMILIEIVLKKGNKKAENKIKEKQKNQRKRKTRQNQNKAKNGSKKFVKVTMKRKDLYNLSNLQRRF